MVQETTIIGDERKTDSFKGATYRVERGEERATIAQGDGWIETLDLTPHDPTDGFQVGALKNSWRTTHNPVNLRTLLIECANIFDNNDYVGYWLDDEGMYHIDPSDYYSEDDYYPALAMGIHNQQRSIWSFIQGGEVPVATKQAFHYFNGSEAPPKGSEAIDNECPYEEWKESLAVLVAAISESKDATRYMDPEEVVGALYVEFGDEFLEMISQRTEAV